MLSITSIHGGTANNVIPDRVEVMGTVRTHDNALRHRIFELIDEKSPAICDLYGCRFVPDMPWNGLPPLVNDPVLTKEVKKLAAGLPQVRQIVESEPLTLGEDFAIYLQELPGVFWTLGGRPPEAEEMCPLHNPGRAGYTGRNRYAGCDGLAFFEKRIAVQGPVLKVLDFYDIVGNIFVVDIRLVDLFDVFYYPDRDRKYDHFIEGFQKSLCGYHNQ